MISLKSGENYFKFRIIYLAKIFFKNYDKTETLSLKSEHTDFAVSRCAPKEIIKGILQVEVKRIPV